MLEFSQPDDTKELVTARTAARDERFTTGRALCRADAQPGATYRDIVAMGQARAAIKGKTDAAREIADRLEGRARGNKSSFQAAMVAGSRSG